MCLVVESISFFLTFFARGGIEKLGIVVLIGVKTPLIITWGSFVAFAKQQGVKYLISSMFVKYMTV